MPQIFFRTNVCDPDTLSGSKPTLLRVLLHTMRVLVVSPHRDDACFSLALALLQCHRETDRTYLLNCFTRSDYAPYSVAHDTYTHDRTSFVSALRRSEDEHFARRVRLSEVRDLDLEDAPIRLRCGVDEVCSREASRDAEVSKTIHAAVKQAIAAWGIDAMLVPMGIGGHCDHVTTRDAVLPLATEVATAFFEDLPYAGRPGMMEAIAPLAAEIAAEISQPLSPVLLGSIEDLNEKREVTSLYASQICTEEATAIAEFSLRYQGCERVWATDTFAAQQESKTSSRPRAVEGWGA